MPYLHNVLGGGEMIVKKGGTKVKKIRMYVKVRGQDAYRKNPKVVALEAAAQAEAGELKAKGKLNSLRSRRA
jgi:hypothetical protein